MAADHELVIVSYHSRSHVEALLQSLGTSPRAVVVDNASDADGLRAALAPWPGVQWVDGQDSGFAGGANLGVSRTTAEYVVFVNPDSRPEPDVLQALVEDLRADPGLGSVAAATSNAAGRLELGVAGWEPSLLRCLVTAAGLQGAFPRAGVYARPRPGERVAPGWMSGACLAVRRATFLDAGGFDERYFVYNEDMAFGRALRARGLRQQLRTDLVVPHAAGSSGGGSTRMAQQRGASMADYLHDHHADSPALFMRSVLALGFLARALLTLLRGQAGLARQHASYVRGIVTRRSPYRARRAAESSRSTA